MAVTAEQVATPFAAWKHKNTDVDENVVSDVCLGPCRVRTVQVTNAVSTACHLKLYNGLGPTVGSTAPNVVRRVPGSVTRTFRFAEYNSTGVLEGGLLFDTGLSYAAVQEGGTGGTTAPAGAVTVTFELTRGS